MNQATAEIVALIEAEQWEEALYATWAEAFDRKPNGVFTRFTDVYGNDRAIEPSGHPDYYLADFARWLKDGENPIELCWGIAIADLTQLAKI